MRATVKSRVNWTYWILNEQRYMRFVYLFIVYLPDEMPLKSIT